MAIADKLVTVGMNMLRRDELNNEWNAIDKARARQAGFPQTTSVNSTHDGHLGMVVDNGDMYIPLAWLIGEYVDGEPAYATLDTCDNLDAARFALADFRLSCRLQWGS